MIEVWLAQPRGFCAGVRRAVSLVRETLQKYGAPVFIRHEIVHNKHVIADLQRRGAVFVEDISAADPSRPLIFSAHGVSLAVEQEAQSRGFRVIDATCPLVAKVHQQMHNYAQAGMEIIVIGKASHPEIIGTVGQLSGLNRVRIINSTAEAEKLELPAGAKVGFVTQTTLAADQTEAIVEVLKKRFPGISGAKQNDICFATTNRQKAIKAIAAKADTVIVIGSVNSSNSRELRETALRAGAAQAILIDDVSQLDWQLLQNCRHLGISAGASAPEYLVEELLAALKSRYDKINVHNVIISQENADFKR